MLTADRRMGGTAGPRAEKNLERQIDSGILEYRNMTAVTVCLFTCQSLTEDFHICSAD